MINCNRVIRESLQRTKRSQKSTHTASINLKAKDSYADPMYLPLKEVVQKKIDRPGLSQKKTFNRSVRLDKSPSAPQEKENLKTEIRQKTDRKFKIAADFRVETDRKSIKKSAEKSLKTIRLRTDYQELLQRDQPLKLQQVSTKHTDEQGSKKISLPKSQILRLLNQFHKLEQQSKVLKREFDFLCANSQSGPQSGVSKALRI